MKKSKVLLNLAVVLSFGVSIVACGESQGPDGGSKDRTKGVLESRLASGKYLPFFMLIKSDGSIDLDTIGSDGEFAKIKDVRNEDFPVTAKIKRIETVTLVTYEGSCEVMVKTKFGYKKVVFTDETLCAQILP